MDYVGIIFVLLYKSTHEYIDVFLLWYDNRSSFWRSFLFQLIMIIYGHFDLYPKVIIYIYIYIYIT